MRDEGWKEGEGTMIQNKVTIWRMMDGWMEEGRGRSSKARLEVAWCGGVWHEVHPGVRMFWLCGERAVEGWGWWSRDLHAGERNLLLSLSLWCSLLLLLLLLSSFFVLLAYVVSK